MRTDFDTLRVLALYTIDCLKQDNMIEFDINQREPLVEAMATEYGVSFATDEDIRDQAIEEVEEKMGVDNMPEDITESEMFSHARKEIIKSFSGENIGGLYLVESLAQSSHRISKFLMDCDIIDDVFGSDEEIAEFLVRRLRQFNPKKN
jgi:hypothetical protein